MKQTVISGDIVSSTSLNDAGKALLEASLRQLLVGLEADFGVFGRLVKGDYVECVVPDPKQALRVMLAIKAFVKSIEMQPSVHVADASRFKHFAVHGIRLAMGYGELARFDPEKGIIDGEAIYWSGRKINEESTHRRQRVTIKHTLFFISDNADLNDEMAMVLALLDVLLSKATSKQCLVVYLKLRGCDEAEIATRLDVSQPVVNRHSSALGWHAIDGAVRRFTQIVNPD